MKQLILIISGILMNVLIFAQDVDQTIFDDKVHKKILYGEVSRSFLEEFSSDEWFVSEYAAYETEPAVIEELNNFITEDIHITLVLGTWCGDSQREVPRFLKITDQLGSLSKHTHIVAVNGSKFAPVNHYQQLNITRVPTFIVYKQEVEIGRIIESPKNTLEKDLLEILKNY